MAIMYVQLGPELGPGPGSGSGFYYITQKPQACAGLVFGLSP
jgi:hypothetical protein